MIVVYASGGSQTNYCDSYDGKYLAETTVIKELIPYIDKNYRTIASRDGRAVQGMSMGGFGAMRLALKYPDLFSSVVAFAGGYRWPEEIWTSIRIPATPRCSTTTRRSFAANHPETWARRNAAKIRGQAGYSDLCRERGSRVGRQSPHARAARRAGHSARVSGI